ncbi:hypothetical protein NK6_5681 [Bradyrhizobium diazoefficiens]|uniref:Uncharacterized protein n=1 Tax=Bradyrhizobium diazoefficiens TaxID=1355477 RepID=A0A0E4BSF6_9BRAD|nr:hypothetical protein NK6_5681 [Bradyrhizobium diazoefficiens]
MQAAVEPPPNVDGWDALVCPSPLVGEGGSPRSGETGEGSASASRSSSCGRG